MKALVSGIDENFKPDSIIYVHVSMPVNAGQRNTQI